MAKKIFLSLVITLSIFVLSTLTLAQTTTTTTASTTTPFKTKPIKPHKPFAGPKFISTTTTSTSCYKEKVTNLNREMQSKKKQILSEYQNALKSVTSTVDKQELANNYKNKIKEVNNWYYQELKQAKVDCGINTTTTKKLYEKREMNEKFRIKNRATTTQIENSNSFGNTTSSQGTNITIKEPSDYARWCKHHPNDPKCKN
jgi:hypothetical protein